MRLKRGDDRPVFTGAEVPASVAAHFDQTPAVFAGLSDASSGRLVIHDFDGDALSPSPLGAAVTSEGFTTVELGPLAELDAPRSGAHQAHGLHLAWDAGAPASLVLDLPPELADLRAYASLRLHIGRTFDAPSTCAAPGPLAGLTLRVHGPAGVVEIELELDSLGHAGRLPAPDRFVPESFGNWTTPTCHALDFVRPLRIPLQAICDAGLHLSAVEAIELRVDGSHAGGLLLDTLVVERGEGEAPGCG